MGWSTAVFLAAGRGLSTSCSTCLGGATIVFSVVKDACEFESDNIELTLVDDGLFVMQFKLGETKFVSV